METSVSSWKESILMLAQRTTLKLEAGIRITTSGDAFPSYFKEIKIKVQTILDILSGFSCGSHLLSRGAVGWGWSLLSGNEGVSLMKPTTPKVSSDTPSHNICQRDNPKSLVHCCIFPEVNDCFNQTLMVECRSLRPSTVSWTLKPILCQTRLFNRPYYNR